MRSLLGLTALALIAAEPVAWRGEYAVGRREATAARKAVCLVISSDNCIYCRKLEAGPLLDPAVVETLRASFVCIKAHAAREPDLVRSLKVTLFPTTILAGHDGTIHAIINGYVSAEQMHQHLKKALAEIAREEQADRDIAAARAALEAGNLGKAAALIRPLAAEAVPRAGVRELNERIELALQNLAVVRAVRPQALLEIAKTLHDHARYSESLDVCQELSRSHAGTVEARAAAALMESIRGDSAKLATATRQASEKAAALHLALAEQSMNRGDLLAARAAYEQVLRLSSQGGLADTASAALRRIPVGVATPASLRK